ncbi:conserved Plasmodium protein, unknown function [Plasmodium berghei]|uniref:ABM domain-containing protein n=2 Tax=Plasmodium berghei TaxID=5821 RepID=A0A509ARY8_PLABA|nr:conserved protein, unknown function [Plasmodium berghei ANKA]CXJ19462.1 conserved Plasmodium protein, unknown function [Plasmodium berghei]SCM26487.1 conserved Plasmodium protein, unknown function [Plasmodium berghei]SCN28483.1 conserved Plasmodium protein, unknown function [Plasmodium berghei]SCO62673.1 conserved Plasmodium protein, unknown function [Plasmodium berghei]SCO64234.1 conserved Plasmodium protein, unknown function [Plasmodium berghei]|eukprot:XP_034424129.1 conserved protein, unknown function [Plasmodium berghei ANKA]
MIGKIFDNAFRIRTYNRFVCFLIGGAFTYSFTNPDIDTVYEFFPIFKQNKYAYLTFLEVNKNQDTVFEDKLKDLCRFYQKQPGYLYTKIIKRKNAINDLNRYIIVSTWLKSENYLLACNRIYGQMLIKNIQDFTNYDSYLYKIVVDDSDYLPPL